MSESVSPSEPTRGAHESDPGLAGAHRVDLAVPLRSEFAATVRTMVASLGADAGFSIDEIDDLRLGLSEVFSAFVESASGVDRIVASFVVGGGRLRVTLCPEGAHVDVELDELATSILRSVADDVVVGADGVTLVKQAVEVAGGSGPSYEPV